MEIGFQIGNQGCGEDVTSQCVAEYVDGQAEDESDQKDNVLVDGRRQCKYQIDVKVGVDVT